MTKDCITHHHACDCREEAHRVEVETLQAQIKGLLEALEHISRFGSSEGCQHFQLARNALATLPFPTGWQPIETAPDNGTIIDLWVTRKDSPAFLSCRVTDCWWSDDQKAWVKWSLSEKPEALINHSFVTHWITRPSSPV
jgi:hypothetical protein